MGSQVSWTMDGRLRPGTRNDMEKLLKEISAAVAGESGVLHFSASISPDGSRMHIEERYRDSAAVFEHLETMGPYMERADAMFQPETVCVSDSAPKEILEAFDGADVQIMHEISSIHRA